MSSCHFEPLGGFGDFFAPKEVFEVDVFGSVEEAEDADEEERERQQQCSALEGAMDAAQFQLDQISANDAELFALGLGAIGGEGALLARPDGAVSDREARSARSPNMRRWGAGIVNTLMYANFADANNRARDAVNQRIGGI